MTNTINGRHSDILTNLMGDVCRDLNVIYIIDDLVGEGVFTAHEKQLIVSAGNAIGDVCDIKCREQVIECQANKFMNEMLHKVTINGKAFDAFVKALIKDDNYPWIANKLQTCLDEYEVEYEASGNQPSLIHSFYQPIAAQRSTRLSGLQIQDMFAAISIHNRPDVRTPKRSNSTP